MNAVGSASQRPSGSPVGSWIRGEPVLPFVLAALIAGSLVYFATAWGPWAFSDAAGYISAARNLVAGHGIGSFKPDGQFATGTSQPPLYVLMLGAVSQLGFEPLEAARALDVLLFGLLVGAGGFLMSRLLSSRRLGMAYSALLMLHPALVIAFTSAMTEPPFILLGCVSLLFLTEYSHGHRTWAFLAAALCAAGTLLTRYPGAAYVLTGVLVILLWCGPGTAARLRRAAAYGAVGGLPVAIFILWSTAMPGAERPRALTGRLEILPDLARFGRSIGSALWTWKPVPPASLLPQALRRLELPSLLVGLLIMLGTLGLAWLCYRAIARLRAQPPAAVEVEITKRLLLVLGIFVGMYLAFFAVAYLITNPTPDVDSRTLLPLLPALLGIVVGLARLTELAWPDSPALKFGWMALVLAALAGYAVISWDTVLGLHRTGLGYTGRDWRRSATIAAVRELPLDQRLISNEAPAVLLLTGRSAYVISEIAQRQPVGTFTAFGKGETEAELAFREQGAALVLFKSAADQFDSIYGNRAGERLAAFVRGLRVVFQDEDGAIYLSTSESPPP